MLKCIHNKRNAIKTTLEEYFTPIKLEKKSESFISPIVWGGTSKQAL